MLIDSHCHLEFDDFSNDFPLVLERAKSSGVEIMVSIGTSISGYNKIIKRIAPYNNIFCSIGVHPNEVEHEGVFSAQALKTLCNNNKVIALGETGLDYYRGSDFKTQQAESFINHIAAARDLDLPVIVHTRDAEEDTLSILKQELQRSPFKAVIHCFTGSYDFAMKCIDCGFFISFSGIVTFKNAKEIQKVAANIPIERLLIETDAPYLAPSPMRGKRNEPAFVAHTAKFISDLRNISFQDFCTVTTGNFFQLFSKAKLK